jgi:hypothetical protein
MVVPLSRQPFVPAALPSPGRFRTGSLSEPLLHYFEANGGVYVDESRGGPWLRLPLDDGEIANACVR